MTLPEQSENIHLNRGIIIPKYRLEGKLYPGRIKSIVDVHMPFERDRTSDDFIHIRDKIFEIFNMKVDHDLEYYI